MEKTISVSKVESLIAEFRKNATSYISLARSGEMAPHAHLRQEAIVHANRADCLNNCADALQGLISG